jgi:SAM-dependent methyltransferase
MWGQCPHRPAKSRVQEGIAIAQADSAGETTWERQRRTFEQTAYAYDRYRPSYPQGIFSDIRVYADLAPDDSILEIGCGTGRATLPLAAWGNPLLAIEPAPAMAELAREKLASHPNVDIRTARFEDDGLDINAFGLVTCAQAYHWLDHGTRVERIASFLYAHGTTAIIANVQVTPDDNRAFWVRVQDVYLEHAPGNEHKGDFRKPDDLPPHPFEGSGLFVDLEQRGHPWHWTLPTPDYIGLLKTHSPHAALTPDVRERLTEGIAELIDREFDGRVTEHYVSLVALARKR